MQSIVPARAAASTWRYATNAGFALQSGRSSPDCQPGERAVVAELEVEEAADRGLAVRELDGRSELRRLLVLGDRLLVGLDARVERARAAGDASGSRPRGTRP